MTKKKEAKVKTMLVEDVPVQVRQDFKAACVRKNKSMKETIIEFMTNFVKAA